MGENECRRRRLIVVTKTPPKELGGGLVKYPPLVKQKLDQGFELVVVHEKPTPGVGTYYVYELVKEKEV